jgi:hypothetical protein
VAVAAVSLLLCPLVGAGLVWGLRAAVPPSSLLRQDPVLALTLMVETAVPSALNLLTLAATQQQCPQAVANSLFHQYLAATATLTAAVPLFLALLASGD